MASKIYTKTGDKGETALFGGTRLPKHHARIEAYGTIDELNSWIGLINDLIREDLVNDTLLKIQRELFVLGSILAGGENPGPYIPNLNKDVIELLEIEIDRMEKFCPPLKNFILPGGHPTLSQIHIARCVCRRAERRTTALMEVEKADMNIVVILNRLSDYLFVLARFIGCKNNIPEVIWKA